jgi:hypothetical protein
LATGTLQELAAVQSTLRNRWIDFRRAFERRDGAAYRLALDDFARHLRRWTLAEERSLVPALSRSTGAPRHAARELKVELVQVRELTRFLLEQISTHSPLADVLGLIENLDRRFGAHEDRLLSDYFPAAVPSLTEDDWAELRESAPLD